MQAFHLPVKQLCLEALLQAVNISRQLRIQIQGLTNGLGSGLQSSQFQTGFGQHLVVPTFEMGLYLLELHHLVEQVSHLSEIVFFEGFTGFFAITAAELRERLMISRWRLSQSLLIDLEGRLIVFVFEKALTIQK